jgi:hypothetical protein
MLCPFERGVNVSFYGDSNEIVIHWPIVVQRSTAQDVRLPLHLVSISYSADSVAWNGTRVMI